MKRVDSAQECVSDHIKFAVCSSVLNRFLFILSSASEIRFQFGFIIIIIIIIVVVLFVVGVIVLNAYAFYLLLCFLTIYFSEGNRYCSMLSPIRKGNIFFGFFRIS